MWPGALAQRQRTSGDAGRGSNDDPGIFKGGYVDLAGDYFQVGSAKLWDLPPQPVPIGIAVSGKQSCELFAPLADVMIAVEPDPSLGPWWDTASDKAPARKVGQLPICWGPDRDESVQRAHELFRWFGGGWKVNAELPSTIHGFKRQGLPVHPGGGVAGSIPCGDYGGGGGVMPPPRSGRRDSPMWRWSRSAAPNTSRTGSCRPHGADRRAEGFCELIVALRHC